jgi:hypothetical protein
MEKPSRLNGDKTVAHPLKNGSSIYVHHGASRVAARIRFRENGSLQAGREKIARLKLASPIFAFIGDRFVVRDSSERHGMRKELLAATAFGDFDKSVQVIAFLLGGGLALSSHGTKAATRAVINTSPEPVSNIVVSVAEDILAVVSILLAVFLPVLVFFVIAAGLAVSLWVLPRVIKFFRQVFRKIRGLFSPATA